MEDQGEATIDPGVLHIPILEVRLEIADTVGILGHEAHQEAVGSAPSVPEANPDIAPGHKVIPEEEATDLEVIPEVGQEIEGTVHIVILEVGQEVEETVHKVIPEVGQEIEGTVHKVIQEVGQEVEETVHEVIPEVGQEEEINHRVIPVPDLAVIQETEIDTDQSRETTPKKEDPKTHQIGQQAVNMNQTKNILLILEVQEPEHLAIHALGKNLSSIKKEIQIAVSHPLLQEVEVRAQMEVKKGHLCRGRKNQEADRIGVHLPGSPFKGIKEEILRAVYLVSLQRNPLHHKAVVRAQIQVDQVLLHVGKENQKANHLLNGILLRGIKIENLIAVCQVFHLLNQQGEVLIQKEGDKRHLFK